MQNDPYVLPEDYVRAPLVAACIPPDIDYEAITMEANSHTIAATGSDPTGPISAAELTDKQLRDRLVQRLAGPCGCSAEQLEGVLLEMQRVVANLSPAELRAFRRIFKCIG